MSYVWLEITPDTAAVAMFELKELLVSAGWTVLASGDGLALYGAASDVITTGAPGVNGMGNTKAWFRIEHPDGVREFTIQQSSTLNNYRIKFSRTAGFTGAPTGGGSIDVTHTGSATDQIVIKGGGTDDAPSMTAVFSGTDGSFRWKAGADNASPYNMWAFQFINGGSTPNGCIHIETLTQLETTDADGTWIRIKTSTPSGTNLSDDDTNGGSAFTATTAPTPDDWLMCSAYVMEADGAAVWPNSQGTNPISGAVELATILFGRKAAAEPGPGMKGVSSQMLWVGTNRTTGSALSIASANAMDYIVMDAIALPWKGTVPVI